MNLQEALKTDYPLIPMDDIDDEARMLAVRWHENATDWIGDKHKLASDIMNYARRKNEQQAKELSRYILPDGNVNYEAVILINCLRLLGKEAQGRLIRNLIERGADYTPTPVADSSTDAP